MEVWKFDVSVQELEEIGVKDLEDGVGIKGGALVHY